MNLNEISSTKKYKKINRIFESRFGFTVDFNSMSLRKAKKIVSALSEGLNKIRKSSAIHSSEKNPNYLELLMVRESMIEWINDKQRIITEGEVGQAEAILAARDIVDSIQKMIETVGKIMNEQLPALSDTIRDQIGSEQATSFRDQIGPMLTGVSTQLMQARDGTDAAVRQLTGEETSPDSMDMGADVDALPDEGDELDLGADDDMGGDVDLPDFDDAGLDRARR